MDTVGNIGRFHFYIDRMPGGLDELANTYCAQFFDGIYCLAFVCEEKELLKRMVNGRKIEDKNWLQGSVDYNRYFMEHDRIGGQKYDLYDITGKSVSEAADYVVQWVYQIMDRLNKD